MKRLGTDHLSKTAIDPELASLLLHGAGGTAAGHVGGNLARILAGKLTPDVFPRAAQTGVQHGFERRRLAPSLEKFLATGVMPESVAEYRMGREAGRVGRVVQRALETEDPSLRFQRLSRMKRLMDKDTPSQSPLSQEMSRAIKTRLGEMTPQEAESEMAKRLGRTPLGRSAQTIAADVGSRIAGTAPPATKAFKVPRFMTAHEKAKPSLLGRAAGMGAMAAGVAAEPGYAGHLAINKIRHMIGESKPGQRAMRKSVEKGFQGQKTGPVMRGMRDVALTPFLSELEDVGHAMNIAKPMKASITERLMQPGSRMGTIGQKLKTLPSRASMGVRQLVGKTKQLAGRARQAIPWPRAPKV